MNYLILSGSLLVLSEIGAYFWHRFGTHENIIPQFVGVQKSHDIHHTIIDDQAHGDFFYIAIFLIVYFFILIYLVYINKISYILATSLYLPIFLASLYNWFIHAAYHIENHWLNEYSWFQNDKRIHFQHHWNPNTNYGIASHFMDTILETFDYGYLKDIN